MKITACFTTIFLTITGFSQVYGDLFKDKRPITKDIDYTINYSQKGMIVFDIAVDMEGNVTSCVLNNEKSTITATPAVVQAKNKILTSLKFERGYTWPKFHNGYVQISTVKGVKTEDNKFAPPPQ